MCLIGKIFGSKIIFIETIANMNTKTVTGKLVYKFADLFLVQWEDMLKTLSKSKVFWKFILGGCYDICDFRDSGQTFYKTFRNDSKSK